jgi:pyruvate formate lyase activating enzyme
MRQDTNIGALQVADAAAALGCASVAFTYNDPVVFLEYVVDVADACRERGIRAVAVTAGYICAAPRSSSTSTWTPPTST